MSNLIINGVRDEKIQQTMITITGVELSGDLQYCKIFVSIFGEDPKDVDLVIHKLSLIHISDPTRQDRIS